MFTYGTANLTEVLWTFTALCGLLVSQWALVDATADLHYLQSRGLNGARERLARGAVIEEAIRLGIQATFLMVGFLAMLTEPVNPSGRMTALGIAVASALILAELALVFKSIYARRVRHDVIRLLMRPEYEP